MLSEHILSRNCEADALTPTMVIVQFSIHVLSQLQLSVSVGVVVGFSCLNTLCFNLCCRGLVRFWIWLAVNSASFFNQTWSFIGKFI